MIYSCIVELIKDWLIPLGAIGVAIWIPEKIRWEQQYSSLLDELVLIMQLHIRALFSSFVMIVVKT